MKPIIKQMVRLISFTGFLGAASYATASSLQFWEQDGASVGEYHAGYAALANDASTSWYNPAGIPRINNQQLVLGSVAVLSDIQYRGQVQAQINSNQNIFLADQNVVAQGGGFKFIPDIHYVAPITERIGFGFSVAAPFGFQTNYGYNTPLRYVATNSQVQVIDISPAFGVQLTDKLSFGVGLDIQRMDAEFDLVANNGVIGSDTTSTNKGSDTALGYHLGALWQFNPNNRVGLSFHSQVVHHLLNGTSAFVGPLANPNTFFDGQATTQNNLRSNIALPPYTALSGYHRAEGSKWGFMGTVIYTRWSTLQSLALQNVVGINEDLDGALITVTAPEFYRNTWNYAIGTEYYMSDTTTFRGGVGYDQSPTKDEFRAVQAPDADRFVVALGGHYQASKALGFDLGWEHVFVKSAPIHPPTQITGAQQTITDGTSRASADVFAGQLTWDIL